MLATGVYIHPMGVCHLAWLWVVLACRHTVLLGCVCVDQLQRVVWVCVLFGCVCCLVCDLFGCVLFRRVFCLGVCVV